MRIAIANSSLCVSKGGSERAAARLAGELGDRGHQVYMLAPKGPAPPLYPIDPRVAVHLVPESLRSGDPRVVAEAASLLKDNDVDALISFESGWMHGRWHACALPGRIPFVCSERITPRLVETVFWNRKERGEFLRKCDAIHELLPCYLRYIPEELRERTFVIPNAAMENAPAEYPGHLSQKPVILYLGRFSGQKRPRLLLETFAILAGEFPEWTLRFAGWGDEQASLEALRQKHGLSGRVEIRPALDNVAEEYLNADIYCLPTRHEGFPNAVLEAMGNGLPVAGIADCEAMTSIIRPGRNGLLASRADPRSLAEVLRPLMRSPKARERMGRAAWRDCSEAYNPKIIFDQWEKELEKVVAKRRGG